MTNSAASSTAMNAINFFFEESCFINVTRNGKSVVK